MAITTTHGSLSGSTYVDDLLWGGWKWTSTTSAPVTLLYYYDFTSNYEAADGQPTGVWHDFEKAAYSSAAQAWSNVANLHFAETSDFDSANLDEWLLSTPQITFYTGAPHSGSHQVPTFSSSPYREVGVYNYQIHSAGDATWTAAQLAVGGDRWETFIHEIGHGLGLQHPFDNSGSGGGVFPGVTLGQSADSGDNHLDFIFYTVMAYNEDYSFDVDGHIVIHDTGEFFKIDGNFVYDYGVPATPMALDIAAIQYLYGANMSFHTKNDVYILPDANEPNVAVWRCIWDAGGNDEIRYNGTRDAILDLTAATLDDSPTGGGVLSYAANIYGGYTIAHGVAIEIATGGNGNDSITGNAFANTLSGRGGDDTLAGGLGRDKLAGGAGFDTFDFNNVSDTGATKSLRDHITDFKHAQDHIDLHGIDADTNLDNDQDFTFIGKAAFSHTADELRFSILKSHSGKHIIKNVIVSGDVNGDGLADFTIQLDKHKSVTVDDFVL
jgi:hypothetical protein